MPIIQKGQPVPQQPAEPYRGGTLGYDISVYHDAETDVELLLGYKGDFITIRVGHDRLQLSSKEWRGLYSGVLNIGPGRPTS